MHLLRLGAPRNAGCPGRPRGYGGAGVRRGPEAMFASSGPRRHCRTSRPLRPPIGSRRHVEELPKRSQIDRVNALLRSPRVHRVSKVRLDVVDVLLDVLTPHERGLVRRNAGGRMENAARRFWQHPARRHPKYRLAALGSHRCVVTTLEGSHDRARHRIHHHGRHARKARRRQMHLALCVAASGAEARASNACAMLISALLLLLLFDRDLERSLGRAMQHIPCKQRHCIGRPTRESRNSRRLKKSSSPPKGPEKGV